MYLGRVIKTMVAIAALQLTPACKADRAPHVLVTGAAQKSWPAAARQILDTFGEHHPSTERVSAFATILEEENTLHVNREVPGVMRKNIRCSRPYDCEHRDLKNAFNLRMGTSIYLGPRAFQFVCASLGTCGIAPGNLEHHLPVAPQNVTSQRSSEDAGIPDVSVVDVETRRDVGAEVRSRRPGGHHIRRPGQTTPGPTCIPIPGIRTCP